MVLDMVPKTVGMLLGFVLFAVALLLLKKGKMTGKVRIIMLMASTALGFLLFAPMLPIQLQALVLGDSASLGGPVMMIVIIFALFSVLTAVFGRVYCGYVCPIGTIQELAYEVPVKKLRIGSNKVQFGIHAISFGMFLMLAIILSTSLLSLIGIKQFFYTEVVLFTFVFVAILAASTSLYRPFCRFACPYGFILSIAASLGLTKYARTDGCINCGKCEKVCPTVSAGRGASKHECYLCNRCVDVCPVDGVKYGSGKAIKDNNDSKKSNDPKEE